MQALPSLSPIDVPFLAAAALGQKDNPGQPSASVIPYLRLLLIL
jgi:hypothetical protein